MLLKLTVQNYALIKELDLNLDNGLTIITGETGAGKSILLGALSLILGSRADSSVLLDKNEKCIVEGVFRIKDYDLEDFFLTNDIDFEINTILRREVNAAGKSRAFINDTPVTVNLLKDIGSRLIDIHSQHQALMLSDNLFQLNVVDSFAVTENLITEYRNSFNTFRKLKKEYEELKEKAEKNKADLEYHQFHLVQLEEAKLFNGEQEELEREQEILEHSGEIRNSLTGAAQLLEYDENSILSKIREVRNSLARIETYLPADLNINGRITSSYIELDDLAKEIVSLEQRTEANPERLVQVNSRLDKIYSLIQKHRVRNLDELLLKKSEIEGIIKSIVTGDERLDELAGILDALTISLTKAAEEISRKRKAAIPGIESAISDLLKQLGMPNGRFRISMEAAESLTPAGIDYIDFLFSANRQVEPEELSKIASGGELSRVMLSLKSLLVRNRNLPAIIFDEIDSGVSGEVADKVGQILSDMGKSMQVINITHLPQVASRGTKHFHVYKEDSADSTITRIKLLSQGERIQEVARLLSGSEITETAIKNAKELIKAGIR